MIIYLCVLLNKSFAKYKYVYLFSCSIQLCAALNVKMVAHVQTLIHVNVMLVGVEINVKHVTLMIFCFTLFAKKYLFLLPLLPAVCSPGCENGGTCTDPNTCECASGWSGDHCQTRNSNDFLSSLKLQRNISIPSPSSCVQSCMSKWWHLYRP